MTPGHVVSYALAAASVVCVAVNLLTDPDPATRHTLTFLAAAWAGAAAVSGLWVLATAAADRGEAETVEILTWAIAYRQPASVAARVLAACTKEGRLGPETRALMTRFGDDAARLEAVAGTAAGVRAVRARIVEGEDEAGRPRLVIREDSEV